MARGVQISVGAAKFVKLNSLLSLYTFKMAYGDYYCQSRFLGEVNGAEHASGYGQCSVLYIYYLPDISEWRVFVCRHFGASLARQLVYMRDHTACQKHLPNTTLKHYSAQICNLHQSCASNKLVGAYNKCFANET